MRQQRFGDLDVILAGDLDDATAGPLLVLMHGYGAPATDLVDLWKRIPAPAGTRFAFPAAPQSVPELGPGARAWWPIDVARLQSEYMAGLSADLWKADPPGLGLARDQVVAMLGELRGAVGASSLVLGGFSQGAMVACDVAFRSEVALAGLVVLSGAPLAASDWQRGMKIRSRLPVFQSHGQVDPILPYPAGEHLRGLLTDAGLPVDWVRFIGGHGIAPQVLEGLGAFLERTVEVAA